MVEQLVHRIRNIESERNQYLNSARKDINCRRAMHNSQLQSYDQELKPLKRQNRWNNIKLAFNSLGAKVSKMGPA